MILSLLAFLSLYTPAASPPVTFPAIVPFWGVQGHRVVALLAAERLSPKASAEVARLLGTQSLADVATWADDVRFRRPATGPWHYVNIPVIDSQYIPAKACPQTCIVPVLDSLIGILKDRKRSDSSRAEALRFVVHFIADLHQPLHAGDRGDRGGNDVTIRFNGRQTKLHAFWDSGLLQSAGMGEGDLLTVLRERMRTRRDLATIGGGTIVEWAMESHDVARDQIYRTLPNSLIVTSAEAERLLPVAQEALLRASVRLAAVLERSFAP